MRLNTIGKSDVLLSFHSTIVLTIRYSIKETFEHMYPAFGNHSPFSLHSFGICMVLLTIKQPLKRNMMAAGWNSNGVPEAVIPQGRSSKIQPWESQYAMTAAIVIVVGIGVPSKYFDFPDSSLGNVATVTLKRAKRGIPQRTKNVRRKWSNGDRIPIANAIAVGASPNETRSASESSS